MNLEHLKSAARWLITKHYFDKFSPLDDKDKKFYRWHKSHSVWPVPKEERVTLLVLLEQLD